MSEPKVKKEVQKDNIENLSKYELEYDRGQMKERTVIAIKTKLSELFRSEKITPKERNFFVKILKREVAKGTISDEHNELFNRIDMKKATGKCVVKVDDAPVVHFLLKDMECDFYKNHDTDKYIIFIKRKIPAEWQMPKELVLKRLNGHTIPEKDYPKERELIHRISISQREFDAWFDFVDGFEPEDDDQDEAIF